MSKKNKRLVSELFKPGKIAIYVFVVVISLIIGFAILSFVYSFNKGYKYKDEAIVNCIATCKEKIGKGEMMASGPCISNSVAPDWVCDSISVPRNKFVDNQSENQCEAYRDGTNKHFVEVSTTCEFIRAH